MKIRPAKPEDSQNIQKIYLRAFSTEENQLVAKVAQQLLIPTKQAENINFVAEISQQLVAHVAFSPVLIGAQCVAYILAPLAVDPKFHKQGVGTKLVEFAMSYLKDSGVNKVFVYGDPNYYARFGFNAQAAKHYRAPYALVFPKGWQAVELKPCNQASEPLTLSCVAALDNPDLW